jgi:hypothetical protein
MRCHSPTVQPGSSDAAAMQHLECLSQWTGEGLQRKLLVRASRMSIMSTSSFFPASLFDSMQYRQHHRYHNIRNQHQTTTMNAKGWFSAGMDRVSQHFSSKSLDGILSNSWISHQLINLFSPLP